MRQRAPVSAPFAVFSGLERQSDAAEGGADGLPMPFMACPSRRRLPESNRRKRLCRPLRNHSAKAPRGRKRSGAPGAVRVRAMAAVELNRDGPVAWREARPDGEPTGDAVVCLHGFPESSHMWSGLLEALADTGRPALAPDLYALGDSAQFGPATFENSLARFAEWIEQRQLERIALVVHDWGGFVGLAWACDHPDRVAALVISNTGFFADGKWHGMAEAMRSDQGEALVGGLDRDGFGAMLNAGGQVFDDATIDAYWAPFADGRGQRATLEFYRSMDFEKLKPWQGKLAELGVPTLLLWGADDPFAPLAGARGSSARSRARAWSRSKAPGTSSIDEQPERCVAEITGFLT